MVIPLKDVRKELSLESMVISHFSQHGLPGINYPRFEHLARLGKVVLFFDAFDEMADRVRWEVIQNNFSELRRAATERGKVLLTCRTHYFKDRTEQATIIGEGPRLSELDTELYRKLRKEDRDAEVVYLKEFDDEQIRAYLRLVRPDNVEEDWRKIQDIHNLMDLAQRPLLLDMVVKSLPRLDAGQEINAANLYAVYTSAWLEREYEEQRRRVLTSDVKRALMLELAWQLWRQEEQQIHYKDLIPFAERAMAARIVDVRDEEAQDVAREMQGASFLKRVDDQGHFAFMHRSFMEYFLGCRIFDRLREPENEAALHEQLETRLFDQKIVYFLSLMDPEGAHIVPPLRQILSEPYRVRVSENALQILYWSGRIGCDMEQEIRAHDQLREELDKRIPAAMQLAGANLVDVTLEGATVDRAVLENADLSKANLNHCRLVHCNLRGAKLVDTRLEQSVVKGCDAQGSDWSGARRAGAVFEGGRLPRELVQAQPRPRPRAAMRGAPRAAERTAVVQLGHSGWVNAVAFHPSEDLLVTGDSSGVLYVWRPSDGRLLRVLEGHGGGVRSVAFSRDGVRLASGSDDKTVRVWDAGTGRVTHTLEGHGGRVLSVAFSGDGGRLASGSSDQTVRVWDGEDGQCLGVLTSHLGPVHSVAFAPNGKYLVAAGAAGRLQFWDLETFETFLYLYAFGANSWLKLLPDGRFDASGPEALRYLCYTEQATWRSWTAEELQKEFYAPDAVQAALTQRG